MPISSLSSSSASSASAPSGIWDAVVVGGGPAGAAVARLLAAWGHSVLVLTREIDQRKGLAESLPPSSRKILAAVGALAAVEQAGFRRAIGNAVWWGDREPRFERYGGDGRELGFQVFRPDLDGVLQRLAIAAGAVVTPGANVTAVSFDDDGARVGYTTPAGTSTVRGRFVVDASGRTGIVGRRFRQYTPALRMQAFVGVWRRAGGWRLPDGSCTIVETCDEGWAWSIPVAAETRHVVVMVDGAVSRERRGDTLASTYRTLLARTRQLHGLMAEASLVHTWACDASVYGSTRHAGPSFVLVGDAGACIDPLSSFGVKKALASAWVAAIAVRTALLDGSRRAAALEFFAASERQMFVAHLHQSRRYAREAVERHVHPFWERRAAFDMPACDRPDDRAIVSACDVHRAFAALRDTAACRLIVARPSYTTAPLIREREIVLEPALRLAGLTDAVRYVGGVDLVRVIDLAGEGRDVSGLFDAYARAVAPVPLPAFLRSVSLLVARGCLRPAPPV